MEKREYAKCLPEVLDRLQTVSDEYLDSYDEHRAFAYLVAELFETTREDLFQYTDGPKDGGIDFTVKQPQAYTICQCKCPVLDRSAGQPASFDQTAVDEIAATVNMLIDKTGEYDIKAEIRRLRGDFQRDYSTDSEGTSITAILAVFGSLTPQARKAFESQKTKLREAGVVMKLVEWDDVYHALHKLDMPSDVEFEIALHFDTEDDLLAHNDYCYVLGHAFDLYEAFRKHEWNLFEWNVRFQIPNSPVNKRILAALSKAKGRKLFHHYNNGLLVTCKSYRIDKTRKNITLVGPQIVNGCQTVRAICEAYEALAPNDQTHFRDETRLQAKIIRTTDADFIGELVISTNDQNPMNPRNLKSNSSEQREIQKLFRNLQVRWFMERKDGEFRSLLSASSKVRWFRKTDYSVGSARRFRVIDNEKLAQAWFSFIGHSHQSLRGGVAYFEDEDDDSPYSRIFKSVPTPGFWSAFSQANFTPMTDYFATGIPSVYQYLLAWAIASYVDFRRVSYRTSKQEALARGVASGELRSDPTTKQFLGTAREADEYLSQDVEYFLNTMLNNMRESIVEAFSFILALKYTECSPQICRNLIEKLPRYKEYVERACDGGAISIDQDGLSLLGPTYEFLKDCTRQYYFKYEAEIKATPRLRSYLAQRATINKFRAIVIERNESTRAYDVPWKKPNLTFIESLPCL